MTKLEFINEEIKGYEYKLKKLREEQRLNTYFSCKDNSIICNYEIEECQNRLNILKQIKTDLEAWEVVKEELQIVFKGKNHYSEPLRRYELNVIGKNKIDTLNKALEVKE